MSESLRAHLQSGVTTLARAWAITRADGATFGFTDHDRALVFEGMEFRPESGMTARVLDTATGLSVDNSEALGVLSDAAISEADIEAGRFDGAALRCWLVNWADVEMRWLQFRGTIGEIRRAGGAFRAELRGLTEALNRPVGRVYQRPCAAVLGDTACRFALGTPGYRAELGVERVEDLRLFGWRELAGFEPGWFSHGRLEVMSGAAQGLWAPVKQDLIVGDERRVELWEPLRAPVVPGDVVRLEAGCDKRMDSCRLKFGNLVNFRGFPDIPGEDWMVAHPRRTGANTGGSWR